MPLRLIDIIAPSSAAKALAELPNAQDVLGHWDDRLGDDKVLVRLLVRAAHTEQMLDDLQNRFSQLDGFRVMLLPVEATLARPKEPDEGETAKTKKSPERISREELYNDVAQSAKILSFRASDHGPGGKRNGPDRRRAWRS
jgi:hypothetical protein